MGVHRSIHAACAALLGTALGHAAWAQLTHLDEAADRAHAGVPVGAEAVPVPAVERSELWIVIDAQRRQPPGAVAERNHRRLTPEQRLELREQVRRAYDRPAERSASR